MKLTLCGIVMLCALAVGLELRRRLAYRKRLLNCICSFCIEASSGIRHERLTPGQIVLRASKSCSASFIGKCAEFMVSGGTFAKNWRKALETSSEFNILQQEERRRLIKMGDAMGSLDTAGELEQLTEMHAFFSAAEKRAEEELRKKSGMYVSCSLMTGVLALILAV